MEVNNNTAAKVAIVAGTTAIGAGTGAVLANKDVKKFGISLKNLMSKKGVDEYVAIRQKANEANLQNVRPSKLKDAFNRIAQKAKEDFKHIKKTSLQKVAIGAAIGAAVGAAALLIKKAVDNKKATKEQQ